MPLSSCPREMEVKELVEHGQWPQACPPELQAHLRSCRTCAGLALVTDAFQRARSNAAGPSPAISPGLLWWSAQLRRRDEAIKRIARPILGAQIFALAVNLLVIVGFVVWEATHGIDWLVWFQSSAPSGSFDLSSLLASVFSGGHLLVLVPALATLALLGGVAVYLAVERQ
jgi:hypothetical protein